MGTGQVSSKEAYLRLKDLIRKDEILLLVQTRYKGISKSMIYACCGISFKYFEKAYKTGKVILHLGEFGPMIGAPIPWQDALSDYSGQESVIQWCKSCKFFKKVEKYEDRLWLSDSMIPNIYSLQEIR